MKRLDAPRLRTVLLAGVAALLPTFAASQPPQQSVRQAGAFSPPSGPVMLTRVLERALPDGERIVTRRTYEIAFVAEAGGYRIDGRLVSAEVEAPPSLRFLADLERARPDTGLFPMRLDAAGLLLSRGKGVAADPGIDQSATHVSRALRGIALRRDEADEAAALVEQLRHTGMHTAWPADLFRPTPGHRSQSLPVPLPGGATGTVRIDLDAEAAQGGLLEQFRRTILTELGDSRRTTSESWTLSTERQSGSDGGIILPLR